MPDQRSPPPHNALRLWPASSRTKHAFVAFTPPDCCATFIAEAPFTRPARRPAGLRAPLTASPTPRRLRGDTVYLPCETGREAGLAALVTSVLTCHTAGHTANQWRRRHVGGFRAQSYQRVTYSGNSATDL